MGISVSTWLPAGTAYSSVSTVSVKRLKKSWELQSSSLHDLSGEGIGDELIPFCGIILPDMQHTCIDFTVYSEEDRKSTRLNSSHVSISYAVFCLKKK